ncbi:hypothetical protein DFH08DRAFT_1043321 [Mycena albidolilacea]|uniref:Uncharacterized protein n=1 Tax=Mycena albidolilacea TaxID=1033008 RepID=A0AAD7AI52_9AGAR|nr:hypothetical protein DFH08DRAFT_1043321 [Mycena albidolilacea]
MSEPHPIWSPFNHRFAEGLNEYLLGNEPLVDRICWRNNHITNAPPSLTQRALLKCIETPAHLQRVTEDFYTALPVLEYCSDNFGNTTRPRSFKLFISGINKILLFLDNVPGVWVNYFVTEEARGVPPRAFRFLSLSHLSCHRRSSASEGGSPIYSMSPTCPAGFYPGDCDTVEPTNVNDPQSVNAHVLKKAKIEIKEPSLRTPVAKPQGSSSAISAAPHRKPATGAKPTVARELSAANLDVTGNLKSIFTHMVTNKEFGTNPTDKNQFMIPTPQDFPVFVAVVKKKSGARYDFTSHLPMHETVTDLNLGTPPPDPLALSLIFHFHKKTAGFRFCDHHQTLDQLLQTQLELAETYVMASDVTHAHLANLSSAFTLLKRSAQAHYEDAQKFSTALSGFQLHALKCIHYMGTEAFLSRFTSPGISPTVIDHLNGMVSLYNTFSGPERERLASQPPTGFAPGNLDLEDGLNKALVSPRPPLYAWGPVSEALLTIPPAPLAAVVRSLMTLPQASGWLREHLVILHAVWLLHRPSKG